MRKVFFFIGSIAWCFGEFSPHWGGFLIAFVVILSPRWPEELASIDGTPLPSEILTRVCGFVPSRFFTIFWSCPLAGRIFYFSSFHFVWYHCICIAVQQLLGSILQLLPPREKWPALILRLFTTRVYCCPELNFQQGSIIKQAHRASNKIHDPFHGRSWDLAAGLGVKAIRMGEGNTS